MSKILSILLIGLLSISAVRADSEPEMAPAVTLTQSEVMRLSLKYHPEIARLGESFTDRLATAIEAEVRQNPDFKITRTFSSNPDEDSNNFEVELEQPLRPSDFGLRRTYAVALRASADLEQQTEILKILNTTAVSYYQLWSQQERESLLEQAQKDADAVVEVLKQQLAAGQSDLAQQSIFQAEAARFRAELQAVRGSRMSAQADLQRATGTAFANLRVTAPAFTSLPSTAELVVFSESRASLRGLASARREAALRSLAVARADAVFPVFTPGMVMGYSRGSEEFEAGIMFSGSIPIWDKNEGPILRAKGAVDAAEREIASYDRVTMDRLISSRRQSIQNLEARVTGFRDEVIPAYRAAYNATLEQFRAGQATTLQLFEVQKSRIEAEENAFEYAVEALSARTELEQLIGGRLEEVESGSSRSGYSKD
jgi:outer membrane protein TolC